MLGSHIYSTDDLLRYVFNELDPDDRAKLDDHLGGCEECREFVSFAKGFNRGIRESLAAPHAPDEACPDSFHIAALESNTLDEVTANHVRAHVLFCRPCLDDFLLLRRVRREEARESIPAKWAETIERFKQYVIDLAVNYGAGTRFGPATILGEGPALAFRGEAESFCSKAVEVATGSNVYSVEISLSGDHHLTFDIVGSQIRQKVPLAVAVRAETGEELASTETDRFGNGQLVIDATNLIDDTCVLCFAIDSSQEYLSVRIPPDTEPA